jgi:hypothetical protein
LKSAKKTKLDVQIFPFKLAGMGDNMIAMCGFMSTISIHLRYIWMIDILGQADSFKKDPLNPENSSNLSEEAIE